MPAGFIITSGVAEVIPSAGLAISSRLSGLTLLFAGWVLDTTLPGRYVSFPPNEFGCEFNAPRPIKSLYMISSCGLGPRKLEARFDTFLCVWLANASFTPIPGLATGFAPGFLVGYTGAGAVCFAKTKPAAPRIASAANSILLMCATFRFI